MKTIIKFNRTNVFIHGEKGVKLSIIIEDSSLSQKVILERINGFYSWF